MVHLIKKFLTIPITLQAAPIFQQISSTFPKASLVPTSFFICDGAQEKGPMRLGSEKLRFCGFNVLWNVRNNLHNYGSITHYKSE